MPVKWTKPRNGERVTGNGKRGIAPNSNSNSKLPRKGKKEAK